MQYSLFAFVPLAILLGVAVISAAISLRRGAPTKLSSQPRPSAEILYFPFRPKEVPANQAEFLRSADANH